MSAAALELTSTLEHEGIGKQVELGIDRTGEHRTVKLSIADISQLGSAMKLSALRNGYSAASRRGGTSACGLILRGCPIRTGWNSTAAAMVQASASAIIFPMLDMPG